ncbi:hypothetical protein RRG08_034603 [Elysia crispata]|uniref:Uncharacterized protein n=1 Tax=Elysia crispata TaxID=231223 RepID=A0AAE1B3Q7_9GAST|nr:hypothetical protein RRG08_034603 [Elysia crispata]
MDILKESENLNTKNDLSLVLSVKQSIDGQREVLDFYSEPDSIHNPPLLKELVQASNNDGEDGSVLGLQPLYTMENEDSKESLKAFNAEEDGQIVASANQISDSSCKVTPSCQSPKIITTSCSTSVQSNRDVDCVALAAAESADIVEDTIRKPLLLQTSKGPRRPGVILLGRGNSFSLGRSEVIFLHNTKPYRRSKGQTTQQRSTGGILNSRVNHGDNALHTLSSGSVMKADAPSTVSSSNHASSTGTSRTEPGGPSPPPLSNQVCVHSGGSSINEAIHTSRPIMFTSGKSTETDFLDHLSGACHPKLATGGQNSTDFVGHSDGDNDELAALWAHAELIMAGKQKAVLDVLAQFGVGESGEDTKDDEEEEEESVWQVVENKAHAAVR